jgi:hypothetical protein
VAHVPVSREIMRRVKSRTIEMCSKKHFLLVIEYYKYWTAGSNKSRSSPTSLSIATSSLPCHFHPCQDWESEHQKRNLELLNPPLVQEARKVL